MGFAKIFGCDAFAHVAKEQRKKWDKKSKKMIFIGCNFHTKGYQLWHADCRRLIITQNVSFNETGFGNRIQHLNIFDCQKKVE